MDRKFNFFKAILLVLILNYRLLAQSIPSFEKTELINLYNELYKSSELSSIPWNGNTLACLCGQLPKEIYEKALNRVNFFRIVSGLEPVKLNPNFNLDAQNAALLIKANNLLTHYPRKDLKCYTESAASGCGKSCLGFSDFKNFKATSFITGFIQDYGESNYYVGHRRWLLYSKLAEIGYGATDASEALLTVDGVSYKNISTPEYIAYPWNGFVPINLIFPKWSFSIPENRSVDFTNTTITMLDGNGNELSVEKYQLYENFLDHTIVWSAKGLFSEYDIYYGLNKMEENGFLNKRIKVLIKNVEIEGKLKNFEYFVEPIKI